MYLANCCRIRDENFMAPISDWYHTYIAEYEGISKYLGDS